MWAGFPIPGICEPEQLHQGSNRAWTDSHPIRLLIAAVGQKFRRASRFEKLREIVITGFTGHTTLAESNHNWRLFAE
jgi:hypothetical protein